MNIKRKTTGNWAKSRAPVSASELTAIGNLLNSMDVSAIDFTSKTIHPADHRKKNYDGGWRVELQNPTTTHVNVQIQQNIDANPSSVATVLIPRQMITHMGKAGAKQSANGAVGARNSELRYALHGALIRSARSIRHGTSHKGSVDTTKYVMEVLELEGNFSCGAAVMPSGGEAKD